jgi:hypothetical protein
VHLPVFATFKVDAEATATIGGFFKSSASYWLAYWNGDACDLPDCRSLPYSCRGGWYVHFQYLLMIVLTWCNVWSRWRSNIVWFKRLLYVQKCMYYYAFMYVFMYSCMYVCADTTFMHQCVLIMFPHTRCIFVHIYTYTCIHIHTCIYIHIHTYICTYAWMIYFAKTDAVQHLVIPAIQISKCLLIVHCTKAS